METCAGAGAGDKAGRGEAGQGVADEAGNGGAGRGEGRPVVDTG